MDSKLPFTFLFIHIFVVDAYYDPYSDSSRFVIAFPGPLPKSKSNTDTESPTSDITEVDDSLVLVTEGNEKYKCTIPEVSSGRSSQKQAKDGFNYAGATERELLAPLLQQSSCSYKIEPYWTYELCHSRFIRQYHEERESDKDTKLQEYYLGYYSEKENGKESDNKDEKAKDVRTKQIGGLDMPFFEVIYTDGTVCDLTGKARRTSVLYICHELGRGEIYELKETSSCEYEVIILTELLCMHPVYRKHKDPVNKINCHALSGSPRRPNSLINFELENVQARYNKPEEQLYPRTEIQKPPKSHTPEQYIPPESSNKPESETMKMANTEVKHMEMKAANKKLLTSFLKGEHCIEGGTGWWKHEYCYQKKIIQFHKDDTSKTTVLLGVWDKEAHLDWLEKHPSKRSKYVNKDNEIVHQYYGDGDICDVTGRRRFVEVRLKCKDNPNNVQYISEYLIETKTCEYILVVESPMFCDAQDADLDGFIDVT